MGRKEFVENMLYKAICLLKDITKTPHIVIFEAVLAVKPMLVLR